MRVYIRLLLIFGGLTLMLLAAGMAFNVSYRQREAAANREQLAHGVGIAVEAVNKDIGNIRIALNWMSATGRVNYLNIYPGSMSTYGKVQLLQQVQRQMSAAYFGQALIEQMSVMLSNGRVVDTQHLYAASSEARRELYGELRRAGEVYFGEDTLYLSVVLPSGKSTPLPGIVVAELSPVELMERMLSSATQAYGDYLTDADALSFRIADGARTLYARGDETVWAGTVGGANEWKRRGDYWVYRFPLTALTAEGKGEIALEIAVHSAVLSHEQDRVYWLWTSVQGLVGILALAFVALLLNRYVSRPLRRIVDAFGVLERGDTNIRVQMTTHDEFDDLYRQFNEMAARYRDSVAQAYQARMAAQRAELMQMQIQVNPHFLYNSFYHIYRMCRMDDSERAAQFCMLLSRYYEYITRSAQQKEDVPLRREYEQAQTYVRLQQMRFGERMDVELDELPEACAEVPVPRLILQPLLENAVKYAVENGAPDAVAAIRMHMLRGDGRVVIRVEDGGQSLADETLRELSERLRDMKPSAESSGLMNVHMRIRMQLGGESGVRVSRSALGGMCAELIIAIQEGSTCSD